MLSVLKKCKEITRKGGGGGGGKGCYHIFIYLSERGLQITGIVGFPRTPEQDRR